MSDELNFELEDDLKVLVEGVDKIPETLEDKVPEEYVDLDKKALIEKLEAERKVLEETKKQVNEVAALKEGLASLGENLKPVPVAAPEVVAPQKSEDEYKEEFNEKFVEDPYSAMVKFQIEKLGPEIQRLMLNNLEVSKKFVELDPDRRETFKKYQSEIEGEIAKIPPQERLRDTEIYRKAHDRVMATHIDDIVALKVKEALEAQASEREIAEKKKTTPGFAETTMSPPPVKKMNYIVLTQEEKRKADLLGIPLKEYARYLKERGKK